MKTETTRRAGILAATLITAALVLPVRPAAAASPALIDAARKEGSVVWYTGFLVNQLVVPVAKAFEAKYGVKVEYTRLNSADIMLRVTNEAAAGRMASDVFDGSNFVPLYRAGHADKFTPDSLADYGPGFGDPGGLWVATNSNYLTLAYNTDLVKASDVPLTLDALLDPRWKGKMGMTTSMNPTGGPGFVGAVLGTKGEKAGMAYLEKLAAQEIRNVPANQRVVLDQTIAGERPIALMTFNHHSVISAKKGAPVAWAKFDPVVATRTYASVTRGGPHPNAGRLLVDFLMSREGQALFAAAGYIPNHPAVPPSSPELRPDAGKFKTFDVTVDHLANDFARWSAIYKKLFGR